MISGYIGNVVTLNLGTVVTSWVSGSLIVPEASDFPPSGQLVHKGVVHTYTQVVNEEDYDVIVVESSPSSWAPDDPVEVWPLTPVKRAEVYLYEGGDSISCVVPHSMHAFIVDGTRDTLVDAESVEIEEVNGTWYIKNLLGERPALPFMEDLEADLDALSQALADARDELAAADEANAEGLAALGTTLVDTKQALEKADQDLSGALSGLAQTTDARMDGIDTAVSSAQQLADQAKSDAAAAQGLASTASTAASNAHNMAVTAWDKALAAANAGGNLVLNGGFEQLDSMGKVVEWAAVGNITFVTSDKRTGTRSARVGGAAANYSFYGLTAFPWSSGRALYVEGWFKKVSGTDAKPLGLVVRFKTTAGGYSYSHVVVSSETVLADGWTKISGIATQNTANVVEALVGIRVDGPSTSVFLVDDVLAVDVTEAVAAQAAADAAAQKAATAQGDATKALTSANGKNSIITSPNSATGTTNPTTGLPNVKGDLWRRVDGSGNVISEATWDGDSWEPSLITSSAVTNLDVHKLTVSGSLGVALATAQRLVADFATFKLLTADKLLVGSTDNLVPNGDMNRADLAPWKLPLVVDMTDKPAGVRASIKTPPGLGTVLQANGDDSWFDVTPDVDYLVEFWLKADKPGSRIYLELRNQDNGHAGAGLPGSNLPGTVYPGGAVYLASSVSVPTEWTKYSMVYRMSPTSVRARIAGAFFNHSSGTERNAVQYIAGLRIRTMAGSVLISDGAVTAPKVVADEAMATKISGIIGTFQQVFANTITAEMLVSNKVLAQKVAALMASFESVFANKITANMISANEVLADKMAALMATFETVFADKITGRMITADALNGKTMSGVDIYSPSATAVPRVHVGNSRVEVVRGDGENEWTSVTMGGTDSDQMMLFDASGTPMAGFDSTGKGLAQSLDVTGAARVGALEVDGSLTVGGETLEQMLWNLPRGVVARQSLGDTAAGRSVRFRSELGYYGITWRAEPGRLYRVVYDGLASVSGGGTFHFRMRAGSSPGDQTPATPRISTHPQIAVTTLTPSRPGTHQVHLESWVQDYNGTYTVIVTAEAVGDFDGALASGNGYPAELIVEDMGTHMSKADGYYHRAGGTPYSGTPPVETSPPPTRKKYTTTWAANWEASWRGGSLVTDFLQQGYYSPAQRYSMVGFTAGNGTGGHPGWSPTGILGSGGVTIDLMEVWLENESWWYGSGGKAKIGRHGNTAAPGSPQTSGGTAFDSSQWTTGSGRWVKLPSSWYAGFATGANRGITLGEGVGTDQTYYGKFKRGVTKLRATYWK